MCDDNSTIEEWRLCIIESTHYHFPIEIFFGLLSVICFIGGTFGNTVAFFYFIHQRKDNSTVIYILITAVDVVISVSQLPVGMGYLQERRPGLFGDPLFCDIWHYVWQFLSRQSVSLVAVLSITRTLSILFPLKLRISKVSIVSTLVAVCVLQLITGTIMYWFGGYGMYWPGNVDCSLLNLEDSYYFYHVIPTSVWYWLPVLPVIASCFVSLYVLQTSKRLQNKTNAILNKFGKSHGSLSKSKDSATMTIVLLTTLYIIFNMPMCIMNIFWTIEDTTGYHFFGFDEPTYYVNNLVYCLCVPLNSLANPVLYLCRIKRLRDAMIEKTMQLFPDSSSVTGHVQLNSATQHNLLRNRNNVNNSNRRTTLRRSPTQNRSTSQRIANTISLHNQVSQNEDMNQELVHNKSSERSRNNSIDLGTFIRQRSIEL